MIISEKNKKIVGLRIYRKVKFLGENRTAVVLETEHGVEGKEEILVSFDRKIYQIDNVHSEFYGDDFPDDVEFFPLILHENYRSRPEDKRLLAF